MSADVGETRVSGRLDLAGAYPAEAGIRSWRRDLMMSRSVEITDTWELQDTPSSLVWHLVVNGPVAVEEGTVRVGDLTIAYDDELALTVEPLPLTDPRLTAVWGEQVTRLVFSARSLTPAGTTTMTFSGVESP